MKRRLLSLLALPFLALLLLAVSDCSAGEAEFQEPTAYIDTAVLDALEQQTEVDVYIALRRLDAPLVDQTSTMRRQHAAEVQASVLSVLTSDDFTLTYQFEFYGLAGLITQSGVEKLATHPDVRGIELPTKGEWQ